jgi:hypothetical protein
MEKAPIYNDTIRFTTEIVNGMRNMPKSIYGVWGRYIMESCLELEMLIVTEQRSESNTYRCKLLDDFILHCGKLQMCIRQVGEFRNCAPSIFATNFGSKVDELEEQARKLKAYYARSIAVKASIAESKNEKEASL